MSESSNYGQAKHYGRRQNGQFSRGTTGNPKGRPPLKTGIDAILGEMLKSRVNVVVDGKTKSVMFVEAMILRLKQEALTGSPRALERALQLAQQYSGLVEDKPIDLNIYTGRELAAYGWLMGRAKGVEVPNLPADVIEFFMADRRSRQERLQAGKEAQSHAAPK